MVMDISKERMIELCKNAPKGEIKATHARKGFSDCYYIAIGNRVAFIYKDGSTESLDEGLDCYENQLTELDFTVLDGMVADETPQEKEALDSIGESVNVSEYRKVSTPEMVKLVDFMAKHDIGEAGDSCFDLAIQALSEKYDIGQQAVSGKPVYTKAMQEAGDLPPVGCEFKVGEIESDSRLAEFKGRTVNVLGLSKSDDGGDVITFQHPFLGIACGCFVSGWVLPIKTEQEKLIDEISNMLHTKGFSHDELMLKCLMSHGYITRKGESNV